MVLPVMTYMVFTLRHINIRMDGLSGDMMTLNHKHCSRCQRLQHKSGCHAHITVPYHRKRNTTMDDCQVLKKRGYTQGITIGKGSYARVRAAYSARLKINVAVKIINKHKAPKDFLDNFLPRELDILPCLKHKNIVKTYEIFETSAGKVYMVMELGVQGNLLEFIDFRGALPAEFARKLFRQMSDAIKFIHDQDIVHRDIKCENVLLDKDFNLKIADFGFSRRLTYDDAGAMELSKTFCGSEGYAAPEVLQGIPYDGKLYDVWSMGVVLFVMVCGSMPFDDSNVKKMIKIQKARRLAYPRAKEVSPTCKDLIHRILHPDPKKRITVVECLGHPWLEEECDPSTSSADGSANCLEGQSTAHTPLQPDVMKNEEINEEMDNEEIATKPEAELVAG